jgi:hypothetical protein
MLGGRKTEGILEETEVEMLGGTGGGTRKREKRARREKN